MIRFIWISVFLLSSATYAGVAQDANVIYTGLYGNGNLFVVIDKPLGECTNNTWIVIPSDHQNKEAYFSMAMASVASGKKITAFVTCDSGQANTSFEDANYIHFNK